MFEALQAVNLSTSSEIAKFSREHFLRKAKHGLNLLLDQEAKQQQQQQVRFYSYDDEELQAAKEARMSVYQEVLANLYEFASSNNATNDSASMASNTRL